MSYNSTAAYLFVLCVRHKCWAYMTNVVMVSRSGCGGLQHLEARICLKALFHTYFFFSWIPLFAIDVFRVSPNISFLVWHRLYINLASSYLILSTKSFIKVYLNTSSSDSFMPGNWFILELINCICNCQKLYNGPCHCLTIFNIFSETISYMRITFG